MLLTSIEPTSLDVNNVNAPHSEKHNYMNNNLKVGLAVAATAVLAVVITPMLTDKPPANSMSGSVAISASDESTQSAAPSRNTDTSSSSRAAGSQIQTKAVQTKSSGTQSDFAYRESVNSWINEINNLLKAGNDRKARAEYWRFQEQHTERAKSYKPKFKTP